jgi:hypothetical protein
MKKQPQQPPPLPPGYRRRLLLQPQQQQQQPPPSTEFGQAVQEWLVNRTGAPPRSACFVGTFKPVPGDGPCRFCVAGASTTGPDYAGASQASQCACLAGYYSVRSPPDPSNGSRTLRGCLPCPNATYRALVQPDDGVCHPCPPRMYTPTSGSAFCYCVPGTYPNITYDACAPCEAGFYCDGNTKTRCPDQSSAAPGAVGRGECVCDPSTHYGDLSRAGGVCLPRPPGYVCQTTNNASSVVVVGCGCAAQWVAVPMGAGGLMRCRSPCVAGQFARLQPRSQDLQACVACPPDTYAADGGLVDACTPCPLGRGTRGLEVSPPIIIFISSSLSLASSSDRARVRAPGHDRRRQLHVPAAGGRGDCRRRLGRGVCRLPPGHLPRPAHPRLHRLPGRLDIAGQHGGAGRLRMPPRCVRVGERLRALSAGHLFARHGAHVHPLPPRLRDGGRRPDVTRAVPLPPRVFFLGLFCSGAAHGCSAYLSRP